MSNEQEARRGNLAEQQRLFEDEVAEMDAELLSIQRGAMQDHRFSVIAAIRDFHSKPKRKRVKKRAYGY